jgi:serine/threonine protein kinase
MSETFNRLEAALADRYVIERELGVGGMATVYLAEDLKHHRKVAVKVLRPELGAALGSERFLREIEVTAHLSHPHILPLLDSGRAVGRYGGSAVGSQGEFLYYVMPYVEGGSLRDKLTREKQLSVDEALKITSQVATALFYAHSRDIVHRDIKPENILFQAGEVVVADFGIALAVDSAGSTRLTETGLSLGTPAYMSPEQVAGDREIDGRSDIYSLACLLYEMLAGDPPFVASTPRAVLAKHVTDPAPPISTVRPGVSAPIVAALAKALAKAPADRFDSAKAFSEALFAEAKEAEPEKKSIVVLPFDNLSPDPENEYFTDGLTDELIADLSLVRSLRVISRTSAMQLKGTEKDLRTICRELDVQYVLEGSVRRAGSALRITAQLIDGERDAHLWTEKYSGSVEDVFDIQEKVSRAIVDALKVTLNPAEDSRLAARPVDDLVAYECYLKARHQIWLMTEESLDEALVLLERGLAILPNNAVLYATKAFLNCQYLNIMSKPPATYPVLIEEAQAWASQALALDEGSPVVHFAQGAVHLFSGNLSGAVASWARALEMNPNDADSLNFLGFAFFASGRHLERARELLARAAQVDPLNPLHAEVGRSYAAWYSGDFRTVLELWREWRRLAETMKSPLLRLYIAHFHAASGGIEEACELFGKIICDTPEHPAAAAGAFLQHALRGEIQQATEAVTETLEQAAWWDDYTPVIMAGGYAMIGDRERALFWVDRAIEMGTTNVAFLGEHEPFLRRLRGDPRFEALLEKADKLSDALTSQVRFDRWI